VWLGKRGASEKLLPSLSASRRSLSAFALWYRGRRRLGRPSLSPSCRLWGRFFWRFHDRKWICELGQGPFRATVRLQLPLHLQKRTDRLKEVILLLVFTILATERQIHVVKVALPPLLPLQLNLIRSPGRTLAGNTARGSGSSGSIALRSYGWKVPNDRAHRWTFAARHKAVLALEDVNMVEQSRLLVPETALRPSRGVGGVKRIPSPQRGSPQ